MHALEEPLLHHLLQVPLVENIRSIERAAVFGLYQSTLPTRQLISPATVGDFEHAISDRLPPGPVSERMGQCCAQGDVMRARGMGRGAVHKGYASIAVDGPRAL